jgi:lipoprotein-anchoring transpeptidase ErfK/SrfK
MLNERLAQSREAVKRARQALRLGDTAQARQWAEHAAELAPQTEDPWLILAAVSSPQASLDYLRKALQVNPDSPRARKGMEWAMHRLRTSPASTDGTGNVEQDHPARSARSSRDVGGKKRWNILFPLLLVVLGCMVFGFAAWSAVTSPVLASIININRVRESRQTRTPFFAQADIAKPTYSPASASDFMTTPTVSPTELAGAVADAIPTTGASIGPSIVSEQQLNVNPTDTPGTLHAEIVPDVPQTLSPSYPPVEIAKPTYTPTESSFVAEVPTLAPSDMTAEIPTAVPLEPSTPNAAAESSANPTETPGSLYVEIVPDTPTPEYVAPPAAPAAPNNPPQVASSGGQHWIDVDLSQQRLYAYEGDNVVNSFLVSTGTWQYPTVTGKFKIWIKMRYSDMSGPGYYLPDVPYTMYFYKDYGLHGTYWHNNFGTPMSHGCVNLSIPDAAWLYSFSTVGTVVNVHY